MRAGLLSAAAMAFVLVSGGASFAQGKMPAGVKAMNGMLVDAKGMTLYTYDSDTDAGKSACTDKCAMNWPAVTAGADAENMGEWTVITRDDGAKQWAYKGKPLYTFAKDMKAGDTKGDGAAAMKWHMAKP